MGTLSSVPRILAATVLVAGTISTWEYQPTPIDGKAVSVVMTVTTTFNLR